MHAKQALQHIYTVSRFSAYIATESGMLRCCPCCTTSIRYGLSVSSKHRYKNVTIQFVRILTFGFEIYSRVIQMNILHRHYYKSRVLWTRLNLCRGEINISGTINYSESEFARDTRNFVSMRQSAISQLISIIFNSDDSGYNTCRVQSQAFISA